MDTKWVTHGVHYDQITLSGGPSSNRRPEVEILEWDYGERDPEFEGQGQRGRRGRYLVGHTPPNDGTYGAMPIGNYLYAKWRIKSTGEIHEKKVDLRGRLPSNIENYEIYMFVTETELYVFLFSPLKRKSKFSGDDEVIAGGMRPLVPKGKLILEMPGIEQYLIYPANPTR